MPSSMEVRLAIEGEADALTHVSFASKKYWGYSNAFFDIWKSELTISSDYIRNNCVWVVEYDSGIAGYFSLVHMESKWSIDGLEMASGWWLDHLFILPKYIGKGLGTSCIDYLQHHCRRNNISLIHVLADPNSIGFYLKTAFSHLQDVPSTIKGRTTPLLNLRIN